MNVRTIFQENKVTHTLFWLGYFVFLVFVFSLRQQPDQSSLFRAVVVIIPQIALVYANMEWWVSAFFMQKRYLLYGFILVTAIVALAVLIDWIDPWQPPWEGRQGMEREFRRGMKGMRRNWDWRREMPILHLVPIMFQTISLVVLSTAFKTAQLFQRKQQETTELKSEKLDTELKFLKSQINPHFLFNALHNVYALSVIKSDATPGMILKLSDMLRYLLYDCSADQVPLSREISYINNYISLLKLKDSKIRNIETDFDTPDAGLMIEPMLFIPFIENSFKHSKIEDLEKGWISMRLSVKAGELVFEVQNSIPETAFTKDEAGGIGIENVRRRLNLLYPNAHTLNISREPAVFSVRLSLQLT